MKMNQILKQNISSFCEHLDIPYQVEFVREYEKIGDNERFGGKHCGSDAEHAGARMIAQRLEEIGLSNVELSPCETTRYQFNDAEIETGDRTIYPYGYVSPGTSAEGIRTRIVDLGKATKEECDAADISGNIGLFDAMGTLEGASLSGQMEEAIRHGAVALVICAVEDVLNEDTIRVQPPNIISTVPIVGVSGRDAAFLRDRIGSGSCEVCLRVDAEFVPDGGTTYNVIGEIPGTVSDERIIYTAHLDHYFRCLQDNMSTCSTLLGIAKAMVDSGFRPNRTITFAFHGSHETGGQDTRYPYIYGSYKLTHLSHPEWTGKAVANINFEYSALRMKKLHALAYPSLNRTAAEYFPYSPELVEGGFAEKEETGPAQEYYLMSWADNISYHTAGIPTFINDSITEQMYEGTGPYVGRDHSNHDNWDIFDEKILEDTGRYFGGLGMFIDSLPYVALDFAEQAERIRAEFDQQALKESGIDAAAYFETVDRLEKASREAAVYLEERNGAYIEELSQGMTEERRAEWFTQADRINQEMLAVYKFFADGLDRINEYDFIALESAKYVQTAAMFNAAAELLEQGKPEEAFSAFAGADLCAASFYFSEEVAEHMRKQISDPEFIDRRTWAAGREMQIFTHYDLVQTYKAEAETGAGFERTIKLLRDAAQKELNLLPGAMKREINCMKQAAEKLERIM